MITAWAIVAGGLGALARYELAGIVQARSGATFPSGTAAVNLLGAVALGGLVGLAADGAVGDDWVRIAGSGFLGAFTTFSTWMVESVELGRRGVRSAARDLGLNVGGMLVAGVAASGVAYGLVSGL